ncbi:MAG: zinc ABC transporter substrate-binding protein, partial [Chitinispirillaceae bacterium]|nr:zinc ABC transporter substrate-binding protein [Chitinispirillaceae bacterium]
LEPEKSIVSKIKKISPNIKIVELGEVAEGGEDFSFNQEDVISEEEHTGEHIEGKHLHCRDRDPHIWTSLHLLKEISFVISKYLIELHPEKKDFFVSNREKIVARIDSIDTFLKSTLSPYKERKFFIVHPSFGYFAYDYGLVQVAVEVDGKEPSAKEMKKLLQIAKEEKPYFLFVEPQFSKRAASVIAREINCEIATVDPLAEDILSEIYNFGIALKRNFENVK